MNDPECEIQGRCGMVQKRSNGKAVFRKDSSSTESHSFEKDFNRTRRKVVDK